MIFNNIVIIGLLIILLLCLSIVGYCIVKYRKINLNFLDLFISYFLSVGFAALIIYLLRYFVIVNNILIEGSGPIIGMIMVGIVGLLSMFIFKVYIKSRVSTIDSHTIYLIFYLSLLITIFLLIAIPLIFAIVFKTLG